MEDIHFIADLFSFCTRVKYFRNSKSRHYFTWVFDGVEVPEDFSDKLFDTVNSSGNWRANLRYIRIPEGKDDYREISGNFIYLAPNENCYKQMNNYYVYYNYKNISITTRGTKKISRISDVEDALKFIEVPSDFFMNPRAVITKRDLLIKETDMIIEVKNMLNILIDGNMYTLDKENPDPNTLSKVFEVTVEKLNKAQEEYNRLERISDGKMPASVTKKYDEATYAANNLLQQLSEL